MADSILRMWDFSQVRFTNEAGTVLPRRQRLLIHGMRARDSGNGNEIVLEVPGNAAAANGLLVSELPDREILVGDDGVVLFCTGNASEGDGRGGLFYAKYGGADTPAAGDVVAATGGRYIRIRPNVATGLVTDLFSRRGAHNGEKFFCWGYYTSGNPSTGIVGFGDNGGGGFYWNETCPYAGNGGTIIRPGDSIVANVYVPAAISGGAWQRDIPEGARLRAKWFGAPAFGFLSSEVGPQYREDSDAINSGMNAVRPINGTFFLDDGNYVVNVPLRTPASYSDFTLEFSGGAVLYWKGADTYPVAGPLGDQDSVLLFIRGSGPTVKNFRQRPLPGYNLGVAINAGYSPDEGVGLNTEPRLVNVTIEGQDLTSGPSNFTLNRGFVLDYFQVQPGNCENASLQEVAISRCRYSCLRITRSVQPFNIKLDRCHFYGLLNSVSVQNPYGCGIECEGIGGTTGTAINCEFQRLSAWLYEIEYAISWTFIECVGEQAKKIVYNQGAGATQSLSTLRIIGGRVNTAGFVLEGQGLLFTGNPDFAANAGATETTTSTDIQYIQKTGTGTVDIQGFVFNDGFVVQPGKIGLFDNNIRSFGNTYPNRNPFVRNGTYALPANRGRTYSEGDRAPVVSTQNGLPTLRGAENGAGQATISGANTFVDVDFTTNGGVDEVAGATDYKVNLSIASISGAAAVTMPYVSNKTETGFRINVPTAPGVGTSVTFDYEPYR